MGEPTDPGSDEAFSRETCSIAALLSSMTTARVCWGQIIWQVVVIGETDLAVELEEAFAGTLVGVERTDGEELDGEGLTLLDRDGELLADLGLAEEVSRGHDAAGQREAWE